MLPRAVIVLPALVLACVSLSLAGQPPPNPSSREPDARVLSLEEAVNMALADNLSLQTTIDTVSSSQISKGLAESRFDFKLTPSFAGGFGSEIRAGPCLRFPSRQVTPVWGNSDRERAE